MLSDHILYSGYLPVHDAIAIKEAARILKKNGLLVLERTAISTTTKAIENAGFELVAVGEKEKAIDMTRNILVFKKIRNI